MDTKRLGFNAGYTAASGTLLASLVYFFASNWGVLERWQKLAPMLALVAALYGLYLYLRPRPNRRFLSLLTLVCCCIAFGIGLAVIWQTYNSHADSYAMFTIWFAAAAVFSLLTRWPPFYALAYVLGHIAYSLYFFPLAFNSENSEAAGIAVFTSLAAINGLLYALTSTRRIRSPLIAFLSYSVMFGIGIVLSISLFFENTYWLFDIAVVALVAAFTYKFIRSANQTYLLWNGLIVTAFLVTNYAEWLIHYGDESFFFSALVLVALFIWGGAKWIGYVKSLGLSDTDDDAASGDAIAGKAAHANADTDTGADNAASKRERKRKAETRAVIVRALSIVVIAVGAIVGTITLIGFVALTLGFERPEHVLTAFGLLLSIGMTAVRRLNPVIRYTLLAIGLSIGVGTATVMNHLWALVVYLAVTAVAFRLGSGLAERLIWFAASVAIAGLALGELLDDATWTLILLAAAMPLVYAAHFLISDTLLRQALRLCSYYSFLTVFLLLTFVDEHYVYDGLYFVALLVSIVWFYRKRERWAYRFGFACWAVFLFWTYYDTAWKLLHKSWSLAAIGLILLAATSLLERKAAHKNRSKDAAEQTAVRVRPRTRLMWITLAVLLQLLVMSVQIGRSEAILAGGETVYLELLPRDPRSMLQGDYVDLHYHISEPPPSVDTGPLKDGAKLSVVLERTPSGVSEFKRLHTKDYALQPGETVINGKWRWTRIEYGIEHYFVPEGTGLETERTAKYAEVKIARSGDALLVRLLPELPQ